MPGPQIRLSTAVAIVGIVAAGAVLAADQAGQAPRPNLAKNAGQRSRLADHGFHALHRLQVDRVGQPVRDDRALQRHHRLTGL